MSRGAWIIVALSVLGSLYILGVSVGFAAHGKALPALAAFGMAAVNLLLAVMYLDAARSR